MSAVNLFGKFLPLNKFKVHFPILFLLKTCFVVPLFKCNEKRLSRMQRDIFFYNLVINTNTIFIILIIFSIFSALYISNS